jgi:hypothetical protein
MIEGQLSSLRIIYEKEGGQNKNNSHLSIEQTGKVTFMI